MKLQVDKNYGQPNGYLYSAVDRGKVKWFDWCYMPSEHDTTTRYVDPTNVVATTHQVHTTEANSVQ